MAAAPCVGVGGREGGTAPRTVAVAALLFLSGAAGLVYQVTWVRLLGLTFGVTLFAISTVLAAFMAGLGIGSVVGGRRADVARRPLLVYGLVELGVGATALLTPWLFGFLPMVYASLAQIADPQTAPLFAGTIRAALAFVVLLVPTGLMGATLPLALRGARTGEADPLQGEAGAAGCEVDPMSVVTEADSLSVRSDADSAWSESKVARAGTDSVPGEGDSAPAEAERTRGDAWTMGLLYATNTGGAIVGSLLAGFVLIGRLGLAETIGVAALANGVAGAGGLLLGRTSPGRSPGDHKRHASVIGASRPTRDRHARAAEASPTAAPRPADDHRSVTQSSRPPADRHVSVTRPSHLPPEAARQSQQGHAAVMQASRGDAGPLATIAFWAFGVSGAISLAYEVVWSRILAVLFDSSIYGFVLMLATVLFGIAAGGALGGLVVRRWPGPRVAGVALGLLELGIGLTAVLALVSFAVAYDGLLALRADGPPILVRFVRTETRLMATLCVVTVLPSALLMGATFPVAARLWAAGVRRLGERLGGIYAANVAGAIVGSLAAGFVLVPLLGAHYSLLLLASANIVVGAVVLSRACAPRLPRAPSPPRLPHLVSRRRTALPLFLAAERNREASRGPSRENQKASRGRHRGVTIWIRSQNCDSIVGRLAPLVLAGCGLAIVASGLSLPPLHALVFHEHFPEQQLLGYSEGLETTVSVGRDERGVQTLFTNSRGQTNDAPDLVRYHRLMGHLAGLLAPNRSPRALVVGLGAGVTPGALAQHDGATVDVVELSESVVSAAPFFRVANADVLYRPNVHLTIDDGRNFLLRNRRAYDIVTADVVHPYDAGATNLYSVEYFSLVARSLTPTGIMVQWVSPGSAFEHTLIVRTFLQALPNATLWLNGDLLIGSPSPISITQSELEARLADPSARDALAEVGFNHTQDVAAQFRGGSAELHAYAGPGPILTDDHPILEYFQSQDFPADPPDLSRFRSSDEDSGNRTAQWLRP